MPLLDLLDLNPYWWYRAKDQAGANGSSVSSISDASGNGYVPSSVAGATINTSAVTASGKAIRATGLIQLPNPTSMLTLPTDPQGLIGLVTVSQMYNSSYNGDELVNANIGTNWGWASGATPSVGVPQWARFGPFSTPRVYTSYQLKTVGNTNRSPKDWKWQGSNDGSSWVDLDTRAGYDTRDGGWHSFEYSNTTAYSYYRILITANWGTDMVHLDEMWLGNIPNGGLSGAEAWFVVKSITQNGTAWRFGTAGSADHYPFSGSVYSSFGETIRRAYAPSVAITDWRVLRMKSSKVGQHKEWLDNISQLNQSAVALAWHTSPTLWTSGGAVDIAEAFLLPEITDTEASYVYHYLNTEHGLSVAGAVEPPASTPATAFFGMLQSFS